MLETHSCAMVVCRGGSLLSFGLLIFTTCFVGARSDPPVSSDCFQGPDFWCLNQTTEAVCRFTNKRIGVCGYSNKRCQIKTGEIHHSSKSSRNETSLIPFRRWVLSDFGNPATTITAGIQWWSHRSRWRSIFLLHAQSVLATVELSSNL